MASAYPDLRAELDEDDGLEHLQMHTFCDHTQAAIDRGDIPSAVTCFGIADRVIADGDDSMQNAIHVSFLEHLDFAERMAARRSETSPQDSERAQDINEYMDALLKGSWTWKEPPKKEHGSTKKERGSKRRRRHLIAVNRTTGLSRRANPTQSLERTDAYCLRRKSGMVFKWARLDSNQGPTDYESAALTS